jgi:hypothetical protein
MSKNIKSILKAGYLYVVAGITLVMILIGSTMAIQNIITYNILGITSDYYGESPEALCQWKYQPESETELDSTVPRSTDYNYQSLEECLETEGSILDERAKTRYAQDMARAISMLIIAIPVWAYHWRIIRREDQ